MAEFAVVPQAGVGGMVMTGYPYPAGAFLWASWGPFVLRAAPTFEARSSFVLALSLRIPF